MNVCYYKMELKVLKSKSDKDLTIQFNFIKNTFELYRTFKQETYGVYIDLNIFFEARALLFKKKSLKHVTWQYS